jgi:hypothetical protein
MVAAAAVSVAEVLRMRQRDIAARLGWQAATEYRERAGFRIGAWNDRCAGGQLDLVAADRLVGVACGVKTRRCAPSHGLALAGRGVNSAGVISSWSGELTAEHPGGVG